MAETQRAGCQRHHAIQLPHKGTHRWVAPRRHKVGGCIPAAVVVVAHDVEEVEVLLCSSHVNSCTQEHTNMACHGMPGKQSVVKVVGAERQSSPRWLQV